MTRNKLFGMLAAGAMVALMPALAASAEVDTVEGASFTQVEDVGGIEGSCFYLYVPSEMESPFPMITPVIYVYPDAAYESEDDAWDAMTAAGLDVIAEDEKGVIIMVNPTGDEWGDVDVSVYEEIMSYISYVDGEVPLTYSSLQYMIGEGSGATFINNYMTLNAKRIAAVLTFGGEIDEDAFPMYPLPAYIVSGSDEAVDFYINANDETIVLPTSGRVEEVEEMIRSGWETTETDEKTTYTLSSNDVRQVIVSKADAETMDADIIEDCWNSLFRYTARVCLTANFWQMSSPYNDETFVLVKRPNYDEAGMEVVRVDGIGNGIWEDDESNYWYEFVPAAVQEAMESGSDETFPLFVCFHGGGDHPIYEAESIGWAQLCIDHDIIMVSPNASGADESSELIDYMIDKYPVDTSRIYAAGFSGGARSTLNLSNAYPERLAAVAPMSCVSGPFYTELMENIDSYDYDLDLPICVVGQGLETESTNHNYEYVWQDAIDLIWELDEIAPYEGELDYTVNPYWGFPVEDQVRNTNQYAFAIWSGYNYDEDGVPMLALMHTENTTHDHFSGYAELIWSWMSQFSRDTETGAVIYTPND